MPFHEAFDYHSNPQMSQLSTELLRQYHINIRACGAVGLGREHENKKGYKHWQKSKCIRKTGVVASGWHVTMNEHLILVLLQQSNNDDIMMLMMPKPMKKVFARRKSNPLLK